MARFFNDHENAVLERKRIMKDFSDLLFHELQKSVFKEKAPAALAVHLGIETREVDSWLLGEALPNRELICRLMTMFRGDKWFHESKDKTKNSTWSDIYEFVCEVENILQLLSIKLTVPREAVIWHSTSQAECQEDRQDG